MYKKVSLNPKAYRLISLVKALEQVPTLSSAVEKMFDEWHSNNKGEVNDLFNTEPVNGQAISGVEKCQQQQALAIEG